MKSRDRIVTALLTCGVLSAIVYAATDVLAAMQWEGYRIANQAVSELLAVGSPTRAFIVPGMTAYNLLMLAFGIGVWMVAGDRRSLRVTGVLMAVYAVVSWMGLVIFPLRPESPSAELSAMPLSGVLHSIATVLLVVLMFAFIAAGSGAGGRGFRVYSIATIALVLGGGIWAGTFIERVAAGEHPAGFGLIERANIYSSLLWVAVFAIVLLRAQRDRVTASASAETTRAPAMKRVVALVGSGHKGGATFSAVKVLLRRLEEYGDVEGEIVALGDLDIRTCRGCKLCFDLGHDRCPLKDDSDIVLEKMLAADGVIFASPNYSWQVSGLMKVFLDRLGFALHRPRFHGRTATAVVVQGIALGGRIRKYLEFVAGGLGFKVVKGSVIKTLEPMTDKALQQMDRSLAEQARRFHDQLLRPTHPAPTLIELMVFRMGRTGIKLNAPRGKRDWAYYAEKGWFESDYFYPVRLGPFKKTAGALFDWLGAHVTIFQVDKDSDAPRVSGTTAG